MSHVQEPCKEVEHLQWTGSEYSESVLLGLQNFSNDVQGAKKPIWETSSLSLKSKKVKGTHSNDCQVASQCPVWTSDTSIVNFHDRNLKSFSEHKLMPGASLANSGSNSTYGKYEECRAGNMSINDYHCPLVPPAETCIKIMLMNIADEDKRLTLTKIIEDMGGVVTSNGSESTHVVTG